MIGDSVMVTKNLQDRMFSPEVRDAISESIREAVAAADAAGLRPAYEPAMSQLRALHDLIEANRAADAAGLTQVMPSIEEHNDQANMSHARKFELRRLALAEKREQERRQLEFHRTVAELLYQPGQPGAWIKQEALKRIELWEEQGLASSYAWKWRECLAQPEEYGRPIMLCEEDRGVAMRCNSPFYGIAYVG
jgi:hypothetical protein